MTLTIKFRVVENHRPFTVRIAKSNVTGKAVAAIVDSFAAPDLLRVDITNGEGAWFYVEHNTALDRNAFNRWWKVAKLGR